MDYKGFKITFKIDGQRRDVLRNLRDNYIPSFVNDFPEDVESQIYCACSALAQDLREGGRASEVDYTISAA